MRPFPLSGASDSTGDEPPLLDSTNPLRAEVPDNIASADVNTQSCVTRNPARDRHKSYTQMSQTGLPRAGNSFHRFQVPVPCRKTSIRLTISEMRRPIIVPTLIAA